MDRIQSAHCGRTLSSSSRFLRRFMLVQARSLFSSLTGRIGNGSRFLRRFRSDPNSLFAILKERVRSNLRRLKNRPQVRNDRRSNVLWTGRNFGPLCYRLKFFLRWSAGAEKVSAHLASTIISMPWRTKRESFSCSGEWVRMTNVLKDGKKSLSIIEDRRVVHDMPRVLYSTSLLN